MAEESSMSSTNSTTDESTTDDSASNERPTVCADRGYSRRYNVATDDSASQNYERIERDLSKAQRAQDKANARKWSDRQRLR